jgi:hypothetical protein
VCVASECNQLTVAGRRGRLEGGELMLRRARRRRGIVAVR